MKKNVRENPLYNWKVKKQNFIENPKKIIKEFNNNKFEIFNDLCSKLLKYLSDDFPIIDKDSYKKSLIVETRWNKTIEFCIKNTIQKLGDGWGHIIVCNNDNFEKINEFAKKINEQIQIINLGEYQINRNSYNNLCLSLDFWNKINCEKVLIYQSDTFIFKDFDDSFLEWDYIGAPWGPSDHSKRIQNDYNFAKEINIGNGGLSLRTVAAIKDVIENNNKLINYYVKHNESECEFIWEDLFFSYHIELSDKWKVSPLEVASLFSFEHIYKEDTFGCHQPFIDSFSDDDNFNKFLNGIGGVNIYGFANTICGLGHNMRIIIQALEKAKIPYNLNIQNPHNKYENFYQDENFNYFNTNLILCNPDFDFENFVGNNYIKDKYNITLWAWELEELPMKWIQVSEKFDEIWTISEFCKKSFENCLPGKKIHQLNIPGEYKKKRNKKECKEILKLSDKFIVCFTFDAHSDIERKNPLAVIDTFNNSLLKYQECLLVIKSHNLNFQQKSLLNSKLNKNILLINEDWSSEKMEILFNAMDVYISLHRSEGSGLTMMESIMLENPVVCTGWSGNLDFCLSDKCQLVDYEKIDISKESIYYKMFDSPVKWSVKWADPKIEDASKKLIEVYQNYNHYQKLVKENKEFIEKNYNVERLSTDIKNILINI
jgi:glycosyltransferase involved in cell wall biosynthesis